MATLSGGTILVSNNTVTANTRFILTIQNPNGGTVGTPYISATSVGSSFTISSTSVVDSSIIYWVLIEPA